MVMFGRRHGYRKVCKGYLVLDSLFCTDNLKCVAKPNVGLRFFYAFQVVEFSAFLNTGKLQKTTELSAETN